MSCLNTHWRFDEFCFSWAACSLSKMLEACDRWDLANQSFSRSSCWGHRSTWQKKFCFRNRKIRCMQRGTPKRAAHSKTIVVLATEKQRHVAPEDYETS